MPKNKKLPATSKNFEPEYVTFRGKTLESTCGEVDQSQNVEQYKGNFLGISKIFVNKHESPVGVIQWNDKLNLEKRYKNAGNVFDTRWGTGTLISENLFLTAGHCFDPKNDSQGWQVPKSNETNKPINPQEIATNMHVNFKYQLDRNGLLRKMDGSTSFEILELLEHRLSGHDYAIVKLKGNPGKKFDIATISKLDPVKNDVLCIIGHPAGKPKTIAVGLCSDLDPTKIGYNELDTLAGNSGAAILNSEGKIMGVHTTGGCESIGFNSGLRISVLINASPILSQITNNS